MPKKIDRTGEININKFGSVMEVVEYNTNVDMWVKFLNVNTLIHTPYISFKKGSTRSPYDKTVYCVGYIGEGDYKSHINLKQTPQYKTWCGILRRCYSIKEKGKFLAYNDCTVSEEWLNFQSFAKWYDNNFYQIDGERMHVDKDILIKGNKIYSPNTCVFVPQRINSLFVKNNVNRGSLPIGVTYNEQTRKYIARCSGGIKMKTEHISNHNTPEDAFRSYKIAKELVIKDTANFYKDKIPTKLYEALISYKVEITD